MFCCSQNKTDSIKQEDEVMDLIARLPEVIKADEYVIKKTKGKRHLFTYIYLRPTNAENYYTVNVAEDNGSTYYTHFHFAVDPITYAKAYYDPFNDRYVPIKIWRKHHKEFI
ncbi:MAG TPA: hypothetical protein VGN20_18560 [Mucilaginibacter sp.]|jgi:hypothetical protein